MKNSSLKSLSFAVTAASLAALAPAGRAQNAYAISNGGRTLIQFDLTTPGTTTVIGNFAGASVGILGLDFRPANGLLYGYSEGNTIVTIDRVTAVTTLVSTPSTASSTADLGVDFHPVADRLRLVNSDDQNLRINVATGATFVDGPLAYAVGDPNFGVNPSVNEVAYTNNDNDPATGTALYYLDNALDILAITTNPNAGTLTTVGTGLGVNTDNGTGFDILGAGSAYAILNGSSSPSLYSINLATGAATLIGSIDAFSVYGLAIQVPEPGTNAVLLGLALAGVGLVRRGRKSVAR